MIPAAIELNPFALMMDPSLIIAAMERSKTLRELRHQEYHPLDKPLIAHRVSAAQRAFDAEIESAADAGELDDDGADALIDAVLGMESSPVFN